MSALPPKPDIGTQSWNVRFVPKADILRCGKNLVIRSPRRRRASSDCCTVSPRAFAVLRLIINSYFVGAWTGRSAGLLALEDAIDIAGPRAGTGRQDQVRRRMSALGQKRTFCTAGETDVIRSPRRRVSEMIREWSAQGPWRSCG